MKKYINIILAFAINVTINNSYAYFSSNKQSVAVIVNSELYPSVQKSIDQYVADLENEGYNVMFDTWDYDKQDVETLRNVLKRGYDENNLQGAVLIGKIPYSKTSGKSFWKEGPCDSYLMDFDDTHFSKNRKNIITALKNQHRDIWVSRIWAPNDGFLFPGKSEAALLEKYFEKNHLYRTCKSSVPDLRISFIADDDESSKIYEKDLARDSQKKFYNYLVEKGYSKDYLNFMVKNSAQLLLLTSHSSPQEHGFSFSKKKNDRLLSKDIAKTTINQPFLLLNACSACQFSNPRCLGNAYLFNENSKALVIGGLTIPGNLHGGQWIDNDNQSFGNLFIYGLNNQEYFSVRTKRYLASWMQYFYEFLEAENEKEKEWLLKEIAEWEEWQKDYFTPGITLLGDPTLKTYAKMDCPK